MWHGTRIPQSESWIITDPERITAHLIQVENNVELRRVMIEKMTVQRYLDAVNASPLDCHLDYKLYQFAPHNDDEPYCMLECKDTSTERVYHLRVPPNTKSCWEAVAWTFGMDAAEYQPILES